MVHPASWVAYITHYQKLVRQGKWLDKMVKQIHALLKINSPV
jgi:hypothetical protein